MVIDSIEYNYLSVEIYIRNMNGISGTVGSNAQLHIISQFLLKCFDLFYEGFKGTVGN